MTTDFAAQAGGAFATVAHYGVTSVAGTDAGKLDTVAGVNAVLPPDAPPSGVSSAPALLRLLTTPGHRAEAAAVVNGLFGDALADRESPTATPMTIRAGGTVLPLEREHLHTTLLGEGHRVGSRLCILVHGLMSTESIWRFPDDADTTYGTLLAADHDLTVLSVRYNTGRHISTNGRELARLVDQLVRAWPVRVREVSLIGHSMGGLVVRSACHYADAARAARPGIRRLQRPWTSKLRRVVLIGVPNTGAGLAALVSSASAALTAIPVPSTQLIGLGLDRRSAGIKDLRSGAILDADRAEHDSATRGAPRPDRAVRRRRTRLLVVAGSVTADPEHPLARLIGDALVTSSSATGLHDDGELFPGAKSHIFPKVTHNTLAHHPAVYRTITDWWSAPRGRSRRGTARRT